MESLGSVKEDVMWAVELVCLVVYYVYSLVYFIHGTVHWGGCMSGSLAGYS